MCTVPGGGERPLCLPPQVHRRLITAVLYALLNTQLIALPSQRWSGARFVQDSSPRPHLFLILLTVFQPPWPHCAPCPRLQSSLLISSHKTYSHLSWACLGVILLVASPLSTWLQLEPSSITFLSFCLLIFLSFPLAHTTNTLYYSFCVYSACLPLLEYKFLGNIDSVAHWCTPLLRIVSDTQHAYQSVMILVRQITWGMHARLWSQMRGCSC